MAGTIQGFGLLRADAALAALAQDPQRLNQERDRFSESPPSYRSQLSLDSTVSQSTPRDEEQDRVDRRMFQLIGEQEASFPRDQFDAQASEEYNRLEKPRISGCVFDEHIQEIAEDTIRKRWVEQGIWDDRWESLPSGLWKHQMPLKPRSDPEADAESPEFSFSAERAEAKPPGPKTDEIRCVAERRAAQARERDASRPFHQFIYQLSTERKLIQDEMNLRDRKAPDVPDPNLPVGSSVHHPQNKSGGQGAMVLTPPDINTMAYEKVKNTWMKRGIWDRKWGVLPGMSWKHEQNTEDLCREEMGDDFARLSPDAFKNYLRPEEQVLMQIEHEAASNQPRDSLVVSPPPPVISWPPASQTRNIFGPQTQNLSQTPLPAEASHTNGLNTSTRELLPATDPARLLNDHVDRALLASNSQDNQTASGKEHQLPPRRSRQRGNRTIAANGQGAQIAEAATLSPIRPSRVSKNRGKATSTSRQRQDSAALLPEAQQPSHRLDAPIPPREATPAPRRRSERLQEATPNKTAGNASARSTAGSGSQFRPRRTRIGPKPAAPAKPEGVSKARKNTRRKAK